MWSEIADALEFVLLSDSNAVVKHEACFQIGEHNITSKIATLVEAALHDPSELVRHEAVEAMGLLQLFDHRESLKLAERDETESVRQTAIFVMKQLDRLEMARQSKNVA
jgi:deoxyhypusine monooxygenase